MKSKKGGLRFQLDSGPPGMTVSPEGRVTWNVPRGYEAAEVSVILTVRDAGGQEVLHSFRLQVAAAPPP